MYRRVPWKAEFQLSSFNSLEISWTIRGELSARGVRWKFWNLRAIKSTFSWRFARLWQLGQPLGYGTCVRNDRDCVRNEKTCQSVTPNKKTCRSVTPDTATASVSYATWYLLRDTLSFLLPCSQNCVYTKVQFVHMYVIQYGLHT